VIQIGKEREAEEGKGRKMIEGEEGMTEGDTWIEEKRRRGIGREKESRGKRRKGKIFPQHIKAIRTVVVVRKRKLVEVLAWP